MQDEIVAQQLAEERLLLDALGKLHTQIGLFAGITEARLSYSDYDGRNVLVKQSDDRWVFSAVIDFEQAFPGNCENDLIQLYHKCLLTDEGLKKAFFQGYQETWRLDAGFGDRLNYYLLREGVGICSWAKKVAPHYYAEGVELVREFIDKL